MESTSFGDPLILQKPYTKFGVYFMDFYRLKSFLEDAQIPFFALENRGDEMYWILHIADENRKAFDEIIIREKLNISSANQSFWLPDHEVENRADLFSDLKARRAVTAVFLILIILLIAVWINKEFIAQ